MARQETDREDLLREATALVERAELKTASPNRFANEPIVAGFRRDGSASLFFGADPVYQFNAQSELRRAYVAGRLIKAEAGRLAALMRQREDHEVVLERQDLDPTQSARFLAEMTTLLRELRDLLAAGRFELVGQVPTNADVVGRIRRWLDSLGDNVVIANSPRVK